MQEAVGHQVVCVTTWLADQHSVLCGCVLMCVAVSVSVCVSGIEQHRVRSQDIICSRRQVVLSDICILHCSFSVKENILLDFGDCHIDF